MHTGQISELDSVRRLLVAFGYTPDIGVDLAQNMKDGLHVYKQNDGSKVSIKAYGNEGDYSSWAFTAGNSQKTGKSKKALEIHLLSHVLGE